MGASLARVIIQAEWANLVGPVARNLMTFMAFKAQDHDKPPVYWGGRDALVLAALGDLQEDPEKRTNQYRYISRLLRELKAAGAIVPTNVAVRGVLRAAYEIRVMPWSFVDVLSTQPAPDADPSCGQSVHIEVDDLSTESAPVWTNRPQSVDDLAIPTGTEDLTKNEDLGGGGIEPVPAQPHLDARAGEPKSLERCAECGRPERQCRARSAIHGGHDYRPVELAPLRLA